MPREKRILNVKLHSELFVIDFIDVGILTNAKYLLHASSVKKHFVIFSVTKIDCVCDWFVFTKYLYTFKLIGFSNTISHKQTPVRSKALCKLYRIMFLIKRSNTVLPFGARQVLLVRNIADDGFPCNPCAPSCPPCPPCPPYPQCAPPPSPLFPPYYCCPRTMYDVKFVYINDKPPRTTMKDFFDRAAQIIFWTELARG